MTRVHTTVSRESAKWRNEIFTKEFVGANVKISEYLHQLTYEMCYLCGRSTRPVSLPPPVFYADLACETSRCYRDFEGDVSDTSSMMGDDSGNGSRRQVPYRPAPSNLGSSSQKSGAQRTPGSSKPSPNKPGSASTASGKKEGEPLRFVSGPLSRDSMIQLERSYFACSVPRHRKAVLP